MRILLILFILALNGCQTVTPVLGSSYGFEQSKTVSDVNINSLRVRIVRTVADKCINGTQDHMEVSGSIGPDSSEVVERLMLDISPCYLKISKQKLSTVVFLNSNGGLMKDGYKLGQIFRKYQVQTAMLEGQYCASSCAIAFLGGSHRVIRGNAKLMFHAPYIEGGQKIRCPSKEDSRELMTYFINFLGESNGNFIFNSTMDFCSRNEGWEIDAGAAKLFGITTFD